MFYHKMLTGVLVVVGLICSFFLGFYAGYEGRPEAQKVQELFNKENVLAEQSVDFEPFWRAWNVINEKYVSSNGPTEQEKVWGAISGLTDSLGDPYTVFFPPEETELFKSDITGEFQGVGMEIGIRDDILTVIAPLKDTPAFRAGVQPGDKILKIDDTVSADLRIDEAVQLIRGPKGSEVVLTIAREGESEPLEISIVRDVIQIPTGATQSVTRQGEEADDTTTTPDDVFVISLYNFSANSADVFRESLREFVLSNKNKLIIDLRGNPGGFLELAVDMASWFLPVGEVVVREEEQGEETRVYRSKGYDIFNENLKMAILVNGGSASASEILAGALQEHGVATLIGTQTFGKGSVQELIDITDDTSLKITIARWLTPNGTSISEGGLTPDIEVEITREDIDEGRDPQLQAAIDFLSEE